VLDCRARDQHLIIRNKGPLNAVIVSEAQLVGVDRQAHPCRELKDAQAFLFGLHFTRANPKLRVRVDHGCVFDVGVGSALAHDDKISLIEADARQVPHGVSQIRDPPSLNENPSTDGLV